MLFIRNVVRNFSVQRAFMSYYAVARGHKVGIFNSWPECEQQVKGFKGAKYKKFATHDEASAFIEQITPGAVTKAHTERKIIKAKDFWPENKNGKEFDEGAISEADMLTAAASADMNFKQKMSQKRRAAESATVAAKKGRPKHVSRIWEAVGTTHIGDYDFQVDVENYVIVYTDGSCLNNGQRNASAGYGVYFGEKHPLNAAKPVEGRVTNNVGEIQAAIHAIKIAKQVGIPRLCISTDSQFLINAISYWVPGWKRNQWNLKSGQKVKNEADFKELDELLSDEFLKVKWNYVKGHHGISGNAKADQLAREGAAIYKRTHNSDQS